MKRCLCWHEDGKCKARSDWLQLPLAALHINRHRVTSKIRLTMPRVKMSRADRNPWLAKVEELYFRSIIYTVNFQGIQPKGNKSLASIG
jgi:hypothetical protein